jgi:hypothetical protein
MYPNKPVSFTYVMYGDILSPLRKNYARDYGTGAEVFARYVVSHADAVDLSRSI